MTAASRWFLARAKKKYGPYSWRQLLDLAKRGDLQGDDMLLREGTQKWIRADSQQLLFAHVPIAAPAPPPASPGAVSTPKKIAKSRPAPKAATTPINKRPFPWLLAAGAGAGVCLFLTIGGVAAFLAFHTEPADVPKVVPNDLAKVEENKKPIPEPPRKKENPGVPEPIPQKKTPAPISPDTAAKFLLALNRQRTAADLAPLKIDPDLTRGCQAHAKYLAIHFAADGANFTVEDPKKAGYSIEGEKAGRNALFQANAPLDALGRWLGQLTSRVLLLNPDLKSIGLGVERNERGDWFCIVDATRGRGEQVIVYPAPNQVDVPMSFSGGPDVPDATASAGFPISVSFPPGTNLKQAEIALADSKGKTLDGWTWSPEKPPRPAQKLHAIGFIPKSLLQGNSLYQVKASAQVDGKPWTQAWSFTTDDDSDAKGVWAKKALDQVNTYRAHAGLKPVVLDAALSAGCLKHARYLVINEGHPSLLGLSAHGEDLKLPGSSPEGNAAGKASNIAIGDYEPIDAVDSWMATLYHRIPVLAPNLRSIGFACVRGRRQGWATVMNVQGGRDKTPSHVVFYPAPDQVDVPVSFPNGGEEPNPIPDDPDGRAGFPITATFPFSEPLENASGKLRDAKGEETPCWFSSPEKLANKNHANAQGSTICLIAKSPLRPNETYHVELEGSLAGKSWSRKWKFTTGQPGPNVESAAKSVVARLNHFRMNAGLLKVMLDEGLSRGCQSHAEYLAKNADTLIKTMASVNDEDPNLPWFTADGLRTARRSYVFSNAPVPSMQIDDLLATFSSRVVLLDPNLQRIGFGAAHDIGRGWRCVLDPNGGRGAGRVVLFPAPDQRDTPILGFDRLDAGEAKPGFPITVTFPERSVVRNAQATLMDAEKKEVAFALVSPERPLNDQQPRNVVGVYPLAPLRAGHSYRVNLSAIVNGKEWRQAWQFTTAK